MKQINVKALVVNISLVLVLLVLAGLTWWNNERVIEIAADIGFPPGSDIVKSEKQDNARETVEKYVVENKKTAPEVASYFLNEMPARGWKVKIPKESVYTFSAEGRFARLVIHQERWKTRFTFNYKVFK